MTAVQANDVAVIIPTYNGARYIGEALSSVFAQSLPPREVVVVDDRSTDNTVEVVRAIAKKAPVPVRTIVLDRNSGGPARPINVGVGSTAAPLISVLDQDDVFLPDELARRAASLSACPRALVAFSWCGYFDLWGRYVQGASERAAVGAATNKSGCQAEVESEALFRLLIERGNFIWGYPGFTFRREAWREKGGVDETLRIASDYDFLCWLAVKGSAVLVNEIGYLRREHDGNMSRRRALMYREMDHVRLQAIRGLTHPRAAADLETLVRRQALERAYYLREERCYRDSFAHLRLLLGAKRGRVAAVSAMAKLAPHWVAAACCRNAPRADQRGMRGTP